MFNKPKSWLTQAIWKPKNLHSLDHLKFLYTVLCKNQAITDYNRGLLIETLRSISEILIWGDQNDSCVFDFFLEKNMLSFFLRYLQQKGGRYICVQLLQTLNILFENISNETSLYYLLSNNHINSIIVHKFDFSDEEVMAYYISFLKTLSLKLNRHTIHFFYNEHTNDFALYTEAIKFFNHSETMVRIAVRTITLNVFRVDDKAMLRYIRDRTAAPYFSNLVWFIGQHILDLDLCVRNDSDHRSRDRLSDLVAEHLDHLHYLNDILCINIDALNEVLTDQLLNRLLIPLYVYSLTKRKKYADVQTDKKHVSSVVSLFLLSQVFLIIQSPPLVQQLAEVIFQGDISLTRTGSQHDSPKLRIREFRAPAESLEKTLENNRPKIRYGQAAGDESHGPSTTEGNSTFYLQRDEAAVADGVSTPSTEGALSPSSEIYSGDTDISSPNQNSTDEEKLVQRMGIVSGSISERQQAAFTLENRPYLESVFNALECTENDYAALFALCLLFAMGKNDGISQQLLDSVLMPTERSEAKDHYNIALVERLIRIITLACQASSKVRLATLQLSIKFLRQLVIQEGKSFLQDRHLACIENARECSTQMLRNFYKSEEIFLDMFEDEYRDMMNRPLNVEYLMMDASILLPPLGTPLTGIDFDKRLPCGEVERARRAIRVFFVVRALSLMLMDQPEMQLPLTNEDRCVKVGDKLDLNNSDLIACTVMTRDSRKQERRFLVIDPLQLILVEPDNKRLGWGIVRFVAFLQDIEVTGDKDDSRSLHVVVHKPSSSIHARSLPLLSARFIFDDHIRCMAAKQRLIKGRLKARQQKMQTIELLLDITGQAVRSASPGSFTRSGPIPGRSHPGRAVKEGEQTKAKVLSGGSQGARPKQRPSAAGEQKKIRGGKQSPLPSVPAKNRMSSRDEVEEAEEATSATAFQSLNQESGRRPSTGKTTQRSLSGPKINPQVQEIPMEDLSVKSKHRSGSLDSRAKSLRLDHNKHDRHRSHSHSPRRAKEVSVSVKKESRRLSGPQTFKAKVKQTSLTIVTASPHSKSNPIPVSASPSRPRSGSSSDDSPEAYDRSRSHSGQSPKSLRPAEAPTLSLLPQQGMADMVSMAAVDSPILVPPADQQTIHNVVEMSSSSDKDTVKADSNDEALPQDTRSCDSNFSSDSNGDSSVSVSDSGIQSEASTTMALSRPRTASTSEQLAKLAQMVSEHYSYSGEQTVEPEDESG
ncbi:protein CLEC16A-like [Haliotis cracherodii]|uniref:protein CLEC16A-like n=1 Tax=Haliotis cracherodii TaxID=6455 RepID=UPI0039E7334F